MTVHLGILALMIAIIAGATFRMRRRRTWSDLLLVLLAVVTAALEGGITIQEARLEADWDEVSRRELVARSERIVDFLREKGTTALTGIREIGSDPDTRSLLRHSRAARRPVFLDLGERFPPGGPRGVTVYDLRGRPRAWSGWAPTATTSLVREPSRDLESVAIRNGNIYTLLEAIHPVHDEDGTALGYVVHQEPLRVQFPLENDLLRVDDVLAGLEGGGGVRADVALELRVDAGADVRAIRSGVLKRILDGRSASGTVAIVTASGAPCGRVSLSGLTRGAMLHDRRARLSPVRFTLLFTILAIGFLRLWFLSARLPGALAPVVRVSLLVAARGVLFVTLQRSAFDPLDLFDPGWFASIRYGGLLRSPGDLALTGAALLFAVREV
ncbi:hypothetical protein K8I85_08725, partial [bacterium]|nr:hypothetical protein [bacterium]